MEQLLTPKVTTWRLQKYPAVAGSALCLTGRKCAYLGIGFPLDAFVACSFFRLWNSGSFAICNQLHSLHLFKSVCSVCFIWQLYIKYMRFWLTHHSFNSFWEEEAVVQCVHSVIGFHWTFLLQQDGTSVQTIISPKYGETSFFIPLNQSPAQRRLAALGITNTYTAFILSEHVLLCRQECAT